LPHVEGRQSVLAALTARQRRFEVLLLAHGAHIEDRDLLLAAAEGAGCPVTIVAREQLDAMAHSRSHGGVIAVCSAKPRMTFDGLLAKLDGKGAMSPPPLLLLLEGIDDARNLGFTLRSAEAFGADAVLIKKHLWDFDETEVSRPSSGAYERLPLVQFDSAGPLAEFRKRKIRLLGCIAGVRRTVYKTKLTGGVCLAIGGEKRGLSGAVRKVCDRFITIPSVEGASSLPLVAAAATVLGEARRQRLAAADETSAPEAEASAPASETSISPPQA
jgi:23S rRNA (guanosine2251-2'-O)-methyltransferase